MTTARHDLQTYCLEGVNLMGKSKECRSSFVGNPGVDPSEVKEKAVERNIPKEIPPAPLPSPQTGDDAFGDVHGPKGW